ncbi:MAG: tyrosine-type recombinase/integrase [Paludibacter sp.]|nr:tyrosine-type recombinase/integrase [Paludibacter sp.]
MIKASKIVHRNEARIRVDFPYNAEMVSKLRQIADARWSKTMDAWHVPYSSEAFDKLKSLFPEVEIVTSVPIIGARPDVALRLEKKEESLEQIEESTKGHGESAKLVLQKSPKLIDKTKVDVEITVTPMHLYVKLPKNETDIQFLKSFRYAKWDNANYQWVVPNYNRNLSLLQSYFGSRRLQVNEKVSLRVAGDADQPIVDKGQFLALNVHNRTLKLYFGYNKALIDAVKRLALCKWNGTDNCWTLPYSEPSVKYIREFAVANGLEWMYREEQKQKVLPGNRSETITRANPESYLAKLRELRYSTNTIDSYTYMFREFINYYADKELDDITEKEIVLYLQYLVSERKVSTSYQNQAINAIKFYYERVMGGRRKVYLIERPREEKYLPEVLSQEEVKLLLNATDNLKHKAILMTIYSGGLRVSEAVNLKIKDIDSSRMQIRVSQSKGKKDRYTLLSKKALEILRKYVSEYKPKDWLFEGLDGEEYSRRTITEILRKSVEKTGIKKHVTVHTLRHSFATHLLEAGTDIRYIQSLLGHENTKTTEIYTHITTKGFDQIKSPLDNLDI